MGWVFPFRHYLAQSQKYQRVMISRLNGNYHLVLMAALETCQKKVIIVNTCCECGRKIEMSSRKMKMVVLKS